MAFDLGYLFGSAAAGPQSTGREFIDVIRRSRKPKGWVYGRVYGRYGAWGGGACGWMLAKGLHPTGTRTAATCPSPSTLKPSALFARGSYQLGCARGCVYPAVVVPCADPTAYANYDPATGAFSNPYAPAPVGRGTLSQPQGPRYPGVSSGYGAFGARYLTRDGRAYLIKDSRLAIPGGFPHPTWLFLKSPCVARVALIVSADAGGLHSIGQFAPFDYTNGANSLRQAIAALGRPTSHKSLSRFVCRVRWGRIGATLDFLGLGLATGRACQPSQGRFYQGTIGRPPVRGADVVHAFATDRGLRIGDRLSTLRQLYPGARRGGSTYTLVTGRGGPLLRAVVGRGRVAALRLGNSRISE